MTNNLTAISETNKLRRQGRSKVLSFSCAMRSASSLCTVILHSRSTEMQSSMKWGLSREALNESETTSITLMGRQRTETVSGGEQQTFLVPWPSPMMRTVTWDLYHRSPWPRAVPLTCGTWAQEQASQWRSWQGMVRYSFKRPSLSS